MAATKAQYVFCYYLALWTVGSSAIPVDVVPTAKLETNHQLPHPEAAAVAETKPTTQALTAVSPFSDVPAQPSDNQADLSNQASAAAATTTTSAAAATATTTAATTSAATTTATATTATTAAAAAAAAATTSVHLKTRTTTQQNAKKLTNILAVESSTQTPCSSTVCDAQSTLLITADPVGNKTGYVSRAVGLPVSFQCALWTQGRQVALPVSWRFPNTSTLYSDRVHFTSVELTDSGEYVCVLMPHQCCSGVQPEAIHLSVYKLSETAGLLLMLSVLSSIVILVGVFIYSQKKKKYHTWLKSEILAASNSSGDSTPRSSLNRDIHANSKKYLLNS